MNMKKYILLSTTLLSLASAVTPASVSAESNPYNHIQGRLIAHPDGSQTITIQEGDAVDDLAKALKLHKKYKDEIEDIKDFQAFEVNNHIKAEYKHDVLTELEFSNGQEVLTVTLPKTLDDSIRYTVTDALAPKAVAEWTPETTTQDLIGGSTVEVWEDPSGDPESVEELVEEPITYYNALRSTTSYEEALQGETVADQNAAEVANAEENLWDVPLAEPTTKDEAVADKKAAEVANAEESEWDVPLAEPAVENKAVADKKAAEVANAEESQWEVPLAEPTVDQPSKESTQPVETTVKESTEDFVEETQPVEDELVEETQEQPAEETQPVENELVEDTQPATDNPYIDNPMANPENANLSPEVAAYKEEIGEAYNVSDYSLYRAGDPGDHGRGKAVDFMVYDDTDKGDAIADQAVYDMQSGAEDISYVIWKQRINGDWTNYQWEAMEDRGSITANHYDHVHVSFN